MNVNERLNTVTCRLSLHFHVRLTVIKILVYEKNSLSKKYLIVSNKGTLPIEYLTILSHLTRNYSFLILKKNILIKTFIFEKGLSRIKKTAYF